MNIFNKRSLGQKKRKAKKDFAEGVSGCLGYLFVIGIKVFFFPLTLVYYGFIKSGVGKGWKIFYRIICLIVWVFLIIGFINSNDGKLDDLPNEPTEIIE